CSGHKQHHERNSHYYQCFASRGGRQLWRRFQGLRVAAGALLEGSDFLVDLRPRAVLEMITIMPPRCGVTAALPVADWHRPGFILSAHLHSHRKDTAEYHTYHSSFQLLRPLPLAPAAKNREYAWHEEQCRHRGKQQSSD